MSSIRRDLHSNLTVQQAVNSGTVGSSTTTAGSIIDTRGFESIEFVLTIGTRTDGSYVLKLEESDNSNFSSPNDVLDQDLINLEASGTVAATNGVGRVGMWLGNKRYVRASVVSTGVTTGSTGVHVLAILGTPNLAPTT